MKGLQAIHPSSTASAHCPRFLLLVVFSVCMVFAFVRLVHKLFKAACTADHCSSTTIKLSPKMTRVHGTSAKRLPARTWANVAPTIDAAISSAPMTASSSIRMPSSNNTATPSSTTFATQMSHKGTPSESTCCKVGAPNMRLTGMAMNVAASKSCKRSTLVNVKRIVAHPYKDSGGELAN
jgi:hypothetical protein